MSMHDIAKQIEETILYNEYVIENARLTEQLAECQAQTPFAEGPWEEQAYNAGKKEGQRELAECQAREKVLRGALTVIATDYRDIYDADYELYSKLTMDFETIDKALALPSDSTALDTMLKAEFDRGYKNGYLVGYEEAKELE